MRGGFAAFAFVTAVAALTVAACSSESSGPEAKPATAGAGTGTASHEEEPAVEDKPPSKAEVRWVGRLVDWSLTIAEPVEVAGAAIEPLGNREPLGPAERRTLTQALTQIGGCGEAYEHLAGDAPTKRLADVAETMRDACDAYAEGARYAGEALDDRSDTQATEDWVAAWTNAEKLVSSSSDIFADYQPSNLRRIPTGKGVTRATRVESVFTNVVRQMTPDDSPDPPEARCWSKRDWTRLIDQTKVWSNGRVSENVAGFTGYADYRMNLAPEVCEALVDFRYRRARPTDERGMVLMAFAVNVLVHEAQHARGVIAEAAAECYSMQRIRDATRRLGANRAYADELAEIYWRVVYPLAPPAYRSPECKNGGALDAFPKTDRWP